MTDQATADRRAARLDAMERAEDVAKARLNSATIEPEAFWAAAVLAGHDGYDRMDDAQKRGWVAVPSWGRDGWDLGSWPYVVISMRNRGGRYEMAENCEGDITVYSFPTAEDRASACDYLAFWQWRNNGESWVDGYIFGTLPAHLRGPFTWDRCNAERVSS